jgi:hypothetical protein
MKTFGLLHPPAALTPDKSTQYALTMKLYVSLRADLDPLELSKVSYSCREPKGETFALEPVAWLRYWLRYPGFHILDYFVIATERATGNVKIK